MPPPQEPGRRNGRRNQNFLLSYIDLLMNLSISFAAIFMLAVVLINTPTKNQKIADERAKILIVMTWDSHSADDLDLWVKAPNGERVGFSHPSGLIAHLQRDDMGPINDYFDLPDGTRRLRVSIRRSPPSVTRRPGTTSSTRCSIDGIRTRRRACNRAGR